MAEPYRGAVEPEAVEEAAKIARMIVDEETYEEELRDNYRPELSYEDLDNVTLTQMATDIVNGEHPEVVDMRFGFGSGEEWTFKEFIDTCYEWAGTVFDSNSDTRHLEMRGTTQAGDDELSMKKIQDNHNNFIENHLEPSKEPSTDKKFLSITYLSEGYHVSVQEDVHVEELEDRNETTEETENPTNRFWPDE